MENRGLDIKKLKDNLYLMDEAGEATGYILVGEDKVCVIDTMVGQHDLYEAVRQITDKPIIVVNTHGHPDHIYGNIYFDKAYMHEADMDLARGFINDPDFQQFMSDEKKEMPPFEFISEGDVIDIGGLSLKVYEMPGHTIGSVLLLCPEERILFTGDSINHHLWMQLDGCTSIEELIVSIERILFLEKEADLILHGHAHDYDDISLISSVLNGAREIVAGETENDSEYKWFDGVDMMHPFKVDETKSFQQDDHVICYKKSNIYAKAKS